MRHPHKPQKLDERHKYLFSLFHITTDQIDEAWLGTGFRIPLRNQLDDEVDGEGLALPRIMNLARDAGEVQAISPNERLLELTPSEVQAVETKAYLHYYTQVIMPARQYLIPPWRKRARTEEDWAGQNLHLVVAQHHTIEPDPKTGVVTPRRGGPQVLCLLPTSTEILRWMGRQDKALELAPLVLHEVVRKIGYRTICTDRDLINIIDGWIDVLQKQTKLLADSYRLAIYGKVKSDAPCHDTEQVRAKLLLPPSTPRLK